MKINELITLSDNRYRAQVQVLGTTCAETEAINQYGEPLIEVGGEFSGVHNSTTVNFELPAEQRRLLTDFPLVKFFDLGDDAEAGAQAAVYTATIRSRIALAKTALMNKASDVIGETTTTI